MKNIKQRKYNKMKKKSIKTTDIEEFKKLIYDMDKCIRMVKSNDDDNGFKSRS